MSGYPKLVIAQCSELESVRAFVMGSLVCAGVVHVEFSALHSPGMHVKGELVSVPAKNRL